MKHLHCCTSLRYFFVVVVIIQVPLGKSLYCIDDEEPKEASTPVPTCYEDIYKTSALQRCCTIAENGLFDCISLSGFVGNIVYIDGAKKGVTHLTPNIRRIISVFVQYQSLYSNIIQTNYDT